MSICVRKARHVVYNGDKYLLTYRMSVGKATRMIDGIAHMADGSVNMVVTENGRKYTKAYTLAKYYGYLLELSRNEMVKTILQKIKDIRSSHVELNGRWHLFLSVVVDGKRIGKHIPGDTMDSSSLYETTYDDVADQAISAMIAMFRGRGHDPDNLLTKELVMDQMSKR